MVNEKYIDLMNSEIDGINTPEESEKLKEYLAADRDAQHLFDDLMSMTKMLCEVQEIEPSSDLKMNVMSTIYATHRKLIKERSYLKSLLSRLQWRIHYRYAYAFSFGLILGILLYSLFFHIGSKGTSIDISKLYGTISLHNDLESFEKGDHIDIQLKETRGTVDILCSGKTVIAEIALETQIEIEMILTFDETDLNISGFIQSNNLSKNVKVIENHVRLTHVGKNTYIIAFRDRTRTGTPLDIQIVSSGNVLFQKTLSTGVGVS